MVPLLQNPHHWKEALMIIKLCVTRSSTLAAAPPNLFKSSLDVSVIGLPTQFPQTESKSALPGNQLLLLYFTMIDMFDN